MAERRGVIGRLLGGSNGDSSTPLREALQQQRWQTELVQEDLRRLELAMEDEGWRRLGLELEREFSRGGLDSLMSISRAMYLSHPLIQRAVNVRAYYTWAQGVSYKAEDDRVQEEVVDPQIEDPGNRQELYGHQARILTDVDQSTDGNNFLALFTNDEGIVSVRTIPPDEIRDIYTSDNDRQEVWFYHRIWNVRTFDQSNGRVNVKKEEAYYPSWRYHPSNKPDTIGSIDVKWNAPIIHQRTGGLKVMSFGLPETYAALDWARAYRKFLEDWHTIVASLARFAWRQVSRKSKLDQAKEKLERGARKRRDELEEVDPATGERVTTSAGAAWVAPEGVDLTPINKSGAHTSAEDAKPSRLMVGAAMDLPDTILSGDPDQGNLATAKTLDRPTELSIVSRQAMWNELQQDIFRYSCEQRVRKGLLPGRVRRYADGERVEPTLDPKVALVFPPILEHDAVETVKAIVSAATLDGKVQANTLPKSELAKLLMSAIGVEDIESTLDDLDQEEEQDLSNAVEQLREAVKALE